MNQLKILILDDEKRVTDELFEYLHLNDFVVFIANKPSDAFKILDKYEIDVLILDIKLPEMDGIEVLRKIKTEFSHIEVIMISGHGDMDTVIEAMKLGAIDFLKKPFDHTDIQIAIERTNKYVCLNRHLTEVKEQYSLISKELEKRIEKNLIGESKAIKSALELAMSAADHENTNVLITGESGTGKEIIARIIHHASSRKNKNFCAVNCTAIPDTLLESEFFGHKKGAFTGALNDKKGLFELADHGTLFLDEIADMPLSLQSKLLRAIEEKRVKKIGWDKEIQVDVRIISATNQDVDELVAKKKFRLDLFHRLNTLIIKIPPLRERPEDIEPLLRHYVRFFSENSNKPILGIDQDLIKITKKYYFPGNVRELRNLVERALILSKNDELTEECFPLEIKNGKTVISEKNFNLEQNEIDLIKSALKEVNYHQIRAAELLGVSRHTLIRRMEKYNIVIDKSVND